MIKRRAAGLGGDCGLLKRASIKAATAAQLFSEYRPCTARLSVCFWRPELRIFM